MDWQQKALTGLAGAVFLYFCVHRGDRLKDFSHSPKDNWRLLLFDAVTFFLGAVLFTSFLIDPSSHKEAFLSGATWEGAVTGLLTRPPPGER
jgi:hypothetical protein